MCTPGLHQEPESGTHVCLPHITPAEFRLTVPSAGDIRFLALLSSRLLGVLPLARTSPSPELRSHAADPVSIINVRELSEVKVKGRLESVRVYAVDGELHASSSAANPAASEGGHG